MATNPFQTWDPYTAGSWRPTGNPFNPNTSPYFNPNSYYGGEQYWSEPGGMPNGLWAGARYNYLQSNPNVVYTLATAPFASGTDPFSNWVRNQRGQVLDAYEAALSMNPDLTLQQFLTDFGPQGFMQRYMQQAASQRGITLAPYGAGRVQWVQY